MVVRRSELPGSVLAEIGDGADPRSERHEMEGIPSEIGRRTRWRRGVVIMMFEWRVEERRAPPRHATAKGGPSYFRNEYKVENTSTKTKGGMNPEVPPAQVAG